MCAEKNVFVHVHSFPGEKPKLNQEIKQMLLRAALNDVVFLISQIGTGIIIQLFRLVFHAAIGPYHNSLYILKI